MQGHRDRDYPAPRVVVLGGGTGIFSCLQGMKHHTPEVTAIVTVADDGGSSGRLRKDYHMLPPGDVRNCLVALSHADPLLTELFNYRFPDSILRGHSFGNLLLAVLTNLTGEFRLAVERARHLLSVRGKVIPSTETRVVLVAGHPDGTRSTGEQCISRCAKPIVGMELRPTPAPVGHEIRETIAQADLVVIGPGSLYTSLIPNLLVPGMCDAIAGARGLVVLVANLMTQPGETDGFSLFQHVEILKSVGKLQRLDRVVVSTSAIPVGVRERYRSAGADLMEVPSGALVVEGAEIVGGDFATVHQDGSLRHDGGRLARFLCELPEVRARVRQGADR